MNLRCIRRFFQKGGAGGGLQVPCHSVQAEGCPRQEDIVRFYYEITTIEGRLYFLLYASSGLRRKEALSLRSEDVDEGTRMIAPNKGVSGTKNT